MNTTGIPIQDFPAYVEGILHRAGFFVAPNPATQEITVWCNECLRDGGYHHDHCSKIKPQIERAIEQAIGQGNP